MQDQSMSFEPLRVTRIRAREDKPQNGMISQTAYAQADGTLLPYGHARLSFFEVLAATGNGNCLYLALPVAVFKALPNVTDQLLKSKLGCSFGLSAKKLWNLGKKYASAKNTDREGNGFKALLANLLRANGRDYTKLEDTLRDMGLNEIIGQSASRNKKQETMVNQFAKYITTMVDSQCVHAHAVEAIKAVFPFLTATVVASADDGSMAGAPASTGMLACDTTVVHTPVYDITPDDRAELRLGVVLHLRVGGGTNGALNIFEVAELDNKSAHWLSGQKDLRQSTIRDYLLQQRPASVRTNGTCTRCGQQGVVGSEVFCCTWTGCTESVCYIHLGMTEPLECPDGYTCAEHRKGAPVLMFLGKTCFECDAVSGLVTCPVCGLKLCRHHAMLPEVTKIKNVDKEHSDDHRCRACCESEEEFEKPRRTAAKRLLEFIVGERILESLEDLCLFDSQRLRAAFSKRRQLAREWSQVCSAADILGTFVYSLIVCGLSVLAGSMLKILAQINLQMDDLAKTMELRPFQFFYMMSLDPRNQCDGHMLAKAVQNFSEHIVQGERTRRQKHNARMFPPIVWDATADAGGVINLAFCAFDILAKSPTLDLVYGTLMHFFNNPQFRTSIVVRTSLTEQQGKDGICPYDTSYPPAVQLAKQFEGSIVYLWSDWNDEQIADAIRMQNFRIIMHLNGLNYDHLWNPLVMADSAEIYIEWLSLASLLLCTMLSHWTIACSDLVTQTQLGVRDREAVLYIPFPYPNEAYYQDIINEMGDPPASQRGPGLIYSGGLERLTDLDFLHAIVDILHRAPSDPFHGKPKLFVQATPISKLAEIRKLIRAYCEENKLTDSSWKDLSYLLVTYPYFYDKRELILWLWVNGTYLIAIVGGFINPHTRTWDLTHAGIPTLTLTRRNAEWPARYGFAINKGLGVGHVLNTTTREMFSERGTELLSRPECIVALRTFILSQQRTGRGLFDKFRVAKYLMAAFPHLLDMRRKAGLQAAEGPDMARPKLPDVFATNYIPEESMPLFCWGDGIRSLGENEGMEVNQVMCVLRSKGSRFAGAAESQVLAILSYVQRFIHLDRVVGMGGAKATIVGRLKEATEDRRTLYTRLSLWTDLLIALKIEFKSLTARLIHNSEIFREAQQIENISTELDRLSPMIKGSIPRLIPLLPVQGGTTASVGVHKSGENLLPFLMCEAVQEDLGHSTLLSNVQDAWKRGEINENTRVLALMILHIAYFMQFYIGLVLMDHSYGNLFLFSASKAMPWLDTSVAEQLHSPGGVGWCDLGSAIHVGPWNRRLDNRVDAATPLARQCTQAGGQEPRGPPTLIRVSTNEDGIMPIPRAKLKECENRRKQTHGGLGRPEGATPGFYCTRQRRQWRDAGKEKVLTVDDITAWESHGNGALIYNLFCPRLKGVTRATYDAEQQHAVLTPENMMQTMLKYVDQDAQSNLQLDIVALYANLLYHLMRPEAEKRKPVSIARLHPALTCRALSRGELTLIKSDEGYFCKGGQGPLGPGGKWNGALVPDCTLKMECHKGPGVVFKEHLKQGALAGYYVGVEHTEGNAVKLHEYPPCRSNVSVNDDEDNIVKQVAMGMLPLGRMMDLHSIGACFNAGDTSDENNLVLARTEAWRDGKGLIFIPFYVSAESGIRPGEFGNWSYDPFNGKGGIDSYVFNDEIFRVDPVTAAADAATFLKKEEELLRAAALQARGDMKVPAKGGKSMRATRGAGGRSGAGS